MTSRLQLHQDVSRFGVLFTVLALRGYFTRELPPNASYHTLNVTASHLTGCPPCGETLTKKCPLDGSFECPPQQRCTQERSGDRLNQHTGQEAQWAVDTQRKIQDFVAWSCGLRYDLNAIETSCIVTSPRVPVSEPPPAPCGWIVPNFCDHSIHQLAVSMLTTTKPTPTPPGYTLVAGLGYYKIQTKRKTWAQAQSICASEGRDTSLAMPASLEEMSAIEVVFRDDMPFFVGWSDVIEEDNFMSVTGQPSCHLGKLMFRPGQPDGGKDQNCVVMGYLGLGFLDDHWCDAEEKFLCYQPLSSKLLSNLLPPDTTCN